MQCDKILIVPEKEKQKSFKIKFGRQSFFGGWGVVALVKDFIFPHTTHYQ
jgi:hypothetical protein